MGRHERLLYPLILPRDNFEVSLGLCFWTATASKPCKASHHEKRTGLRESPPSSWQRETPSTTRLQPPTPGSELRRPRLPFLSPVSKMATAPPPRPRPGPAGPPPSRPAPPSRHGAAQRAPAAPPRASSTQVAGSAVGGAYFPPLCEVEAGGSARGACQ